MSCIYLFGGEIMQEIINVFNSTVEEFSYLSRFFSYRTLESLGIALVIFLVFMIIRTIFVKYIYKLLHKATRKTQTNLDEKILLAFEKPLKALFLILGIYFATIYLLSELGVEVSTISQFRLILRSSLIILIGWGCYNLTTPHSVLYEELSQKYNLKVDKILFPFLSKVLRVVIIMLVISIVASEWNFDVNGFVTGLGIGGLAFALAAKDALANIFGGLVIILDKPFSIGDWIQTTQVEGIVEDISFRSTKIRTFGKALVTVPNSILANEAIKNWTRRGLRKIDFTLGVTYDTPKEKIQNCVRKIKDMLIQHPQIDNERIIVNFDKFNDSSLDIFLYFFTYQTEWNKYLDVKEDINYRIMDILEGEGVSVAFPSTSLYFETPVKNENIN